MKSVCDVAIGQADTHLRDISRRGIHAAHDTLVISFEENANEREGLDSEVELSRREPLPEGSVAHGRWLGSVCYKWGKGEELAKLIMPCIDSMRLRDEGASDTLYVGSGIDAAMAMGSHMPAEV